MEKEISTLTLIRSQGESVQLGDDIIITVLAIERGQVRIGVSAPKSIPVHREEVYNRIHTERGERDGGNTES